MISSLRPPTRMPTSPSSHPLMTLPCPSVNWSGWPRSQEASNCLPVDHATPTYCTLSWSPDAAGAPEPATRSLITSFVGGSPFGTCTTGFVGLAVGAGGPSTGPIVGLGETVGRLEEPSAPVE